jgi:predicted enzyme related to lactoylglutathione lyase
MWWVRDERGRKTATARRGRAMPRRVRWHDDHRRIRARSFAIEREAEAWQASVEHELRDGTCRDRTLGNATFSEVVEEWLATRTDVKPPPSICLRRGCEGVGSGHQVLRTDKVRHGTIVWVEIPATDLQSAADFYSAVFDWSFEPDPASDRWLFAPPGRGAMGALTTRRRAGTSGVKIGIAVDDLQAAVDRALDLGGGASSEPASTTVGKGAEIIDPSGNHLWVYQHEIASTLGTDARVDGSA